MKLVCVIMIVGLAIASHPVSQEMVDEIKAKTNLWTPEEPNNNIFQYYSEEQIKAMMGAIMDQNRDKDLAETLQIQNLYDEGPNSDQLPDSFDAREKWTECPFPIRDQGHCGSCWAFGAVEAFEDRICIASKGELKLDLSEQNIVSCNYLGLGCSGNLPINAFAYLSLIGIPTEECIPYTSGKTGSAWGCTFECDNPEVSSKRYSCKYPWVNFTTKGIKNEIMTNGPVETAFGVWGDFMNYKTGIYHYVSGGFLGAHAVKLIGWGETDGVQYWLAANSWGTRWGEKGFFKIRHGECNIGWTGVGCTPSL